MQVSPEQRLSLHNWPTARQFTEAVQCPAICFSNPLLKSTLPAVDRLGMPLVTSGQFAYVYKLKAPNANGDLAVRCFRGYLGDRDQRYRAIQSYLQTNPIPFISEFVYAPDGILIGGERFPILFMDWIDGPTLDVYIHEMLDRKEVLLHLSQEWLRLTAALRDAGVAHGDLQHGNIIVQNGSLRLVDHDGIFVPQMNKWTASEVGHQNYQHPLRDPHHFDATLDNFSALVIYLALISLAEQPDLWREFHDENLLFNKADFINPDQSRLFQRIVSIGPEQRRIAETLSMAAMGSPTAVPCLLDLVDVKAGLPLWMNAPANLESHAKSRELRIDPEIHRQQPRWPSRSQPSGGATTPTTPSSSTVQTLFGPNAPGSVAPKGISDPMAIGPNTLKFAKELLGKTFLGWYWLFYVLLQILDLNFLVSFAVALVTLGLICLTYGFIRARQLARDAKLAKALTTQASTTVQPVLSAPRPAPVSITAISNGSIVGNAALNIYHQANCDWVKQIPDKNRVAFSSTYEAATAGFKACQVCSPTAPSRI